MTQVYHIEERRPSPLRTFRSNSARSIPKTCPSGLRSFPIFRSSRVSNMLMSGPNARLSKRCAKKTFLQRQVKTPIGKSSNCGDFLKRLKRMYPVYEMVLCFRTEFEELPPLPEFQLPVSQSSWHSWKGSWGV